MKLIVKILSLFPKNFISFIIGWIFRINYPPFFPKILCRIFTILYKVNIKEAELPIDSYSSLQDFFTRRLKPYVRPIKSELCSPSDGILCISDVAHQRMAIQVKGIEYSLDELLFGKDEDDDADIDHYFTVYLAPHDYHRVHSPVSGTLKEITYIPGDLWPVNGFGIQYIPGLLNRNERMVFKILLDGGGSVFVVMVGAFNVGRIQAVMIPSFVTNDFSRQIGAKKIKKFFFDEPYRLEPGSELGIFLLGSTVVVVFDKVAQKAYNNIIRTTEPRSILMGESLLG